MTELASLKTHADFQLGAVPAFAPSGRPTTNGYSPTIDEGVEDDYVIRCFCDINEDDGNTVLCEKCNTWQHILCYYPNNNAPGENDNHLCVVCEPRAVDKESAVQRQHAKNFGSMIDRKVKKSAAKSHKKKVKESSVPANGWLSGNDGHERASGSPREQGPPTKRPKTNHKSSASATALTAGRKRAGSTTINGQSPTKSPRSYSPDAYSGDFYSEEFMRMNSAEYQEVTDNSYASINVSNDLRTWLNDVDALAEISPTLQPKDVFQRWDRPIEVLKQQSPGVGPRSRLDVDVAIKGQNPTHRWVEATSPCGADAYLGELNGRIGLIADYIQDPKNRWNELRHPEPFVFFHDRLPIYVDCREEGSVMRFVGRSCQANVRMQIIIHGTDFHFCFTSLRPIAENEELTVPWHIRDEYYETVSAVTQGKAISSEQEMRMASWFTNIVANFGGCACSRLPHITQCNLHTFDLRQRQAPHNNAPQKQGRARKKKAPAQISPGSTGRAVSSRAGSEVVKDGENDEDLADSRSYSAKSRSQPSSRDITPAIVDAGMGLGVTMSERERKKLLQQEQLFQKMEEQQGGRKGKRNNSASALTTPNPSSAVRSGTALRLAQTDQNQKQLGFPESSNPSPTSSHANANTNANAGANVGTNAATSASTSASASTARPRTNGATRVLNGSNPTVKAPARPAMVTFATQTDAYVFTASPSPPIRRRSHGPSAHLKRFIQAEKRKRDERAARIASRSQAGSPALSPTSMAKQEKTSSPVMSSMLPPPRPAMEVGVPKSEPTQPDPTTPVQPVDVQMEDAEAEPTVDTALPLSVLPTEAEAEEAASAEVEAKVDEDVLMQSPSDPVVPPPDPPPPPTTLSQEISKEPSKEIQSPPTPDKSPGTTTRPTDLHVTLPPSTPLPGPPTPSQAQAPTTPADVTTPTETGAAHTIVASPPSMRPPQLPPPLTIAPLNITNLAMLSPSVQASTQPSPAKKKMSLSDYLSSKKKKEKEALAQAQQAQAGTESDRDGEAIMRVGTEYAKMDTVIEDMSVMERVASQAIEDGDAPAAVAGLERAGEIKVEAKDASVPVEKEGAGAANGKAVDDDATVPAPVATEGPAAL